MATTSSTSSNNNVGSSIHNNNNNNNNLPASPSKSISSSTSPLSTLGTPIPTVIQTPATPPTNSSAQAPSQPTITLISSTGAVDHPLSPSTASPNMKEKTNPTDSETALLPNETSKPNTNTNAKNPASTSTSSNASPKPGPIQNLTRKLSARAQSPKVPTTVPDEKAATSPSSSSPNPNNSSKPTTTMNPAPTKPNATRQTPNQKASQKKKRKRKGLAGLLLALGCLSASEFEDDPKKTSTSAGTAGAKEVMLQKPSDNVTVPTANPAEATSPGTVVEGSSKDVVQPAEPTGDTLVGGPSEVTDVVVAPTEPVVPPIDETAGVTSSAVQPPGSGPALLTHPPITRRESDSGVPTTSSNVDATDTSGGYTNLSESEMTDDQQDQEGGEYAMEEDYEDEEDRLIAQGGMGIPLDENGHPQPLLPVMDKHHQGRKCLVLDLDETLLHSSFKMIPSADYIVPVEIESQTHNVYVIKRPGVDNFLREMGEIYEIVVFTASLSKYADPVLDMLDEHRVVKHRLFRESCYNHKGNYVKDLSQLGREMEGCIIIDNSPASYIFHPNNAVPVSTWFNDPHDTELTDLCPFLTDLAGVDDIRGVLDGSL